MKILPPWVVPAIGAVLLALIGLQQMRVMDRDTEIEKQKGIVTQREKTLADVNAVAAQAREAWAKEKSDLQAAHAVNQQKANDEHKTTTAAIAQRSAALRADNERLRNQVRGYAAVTRTEGESDASLAGRTGHRLAVVATLLDEGVGLEAESRRVIETRDAEVRLLLAQIAADREACTPTPAVASSSPE